MRATYPQPDGRAIARRKWSAEKLCGPLVHFAELVLKKLIQGGFAAAYETYGNSQEPSYVRFTNELGFTPLFHRSLRIALEIVARRCAVCFQEEYGAVRLDGSYRLVLRYAKDGPKPVGAKFVRLAFTELPLGEIPF